MVSTLVPLLTVLLICLSLSSAHYHAQPHVKDMITGVKLPGGTVKRQAGRQPIRITKIYDSSIDTGLGADKRVMIQTQIIPQLIDFLSNTLSVDRVQGPILLNRGCAGGSFFPRANGERDCVSTCETTRCGEVIVEDDYLKRCVQCNNQGSNDCVETVGDGTGVSSTDVILFVSAIETNCPGASTGGSQTVAFATACQMEADLDRPIAGNINFCPSGLQGNAAEFILELAKHETTHALAFASSLFAYWRDSNGNPRTPRDGNGTPETFNSQLNFYQPSTNTILFNQVYNDWVTINGVTSHTVHLMVTPAVLREARTHFGCATLAGVELENQGGAGTFLSHWEKRILGNEAMTGELTFNPVFSRITLAAYEDSGWYDVDYSMAEELVWGKGAGCDFATGSCREWINIQSNSNQPPAPYCTEVTRGCTVDYQAVAQCNLATFQANLEPEYQFFTNLAEGGRTQIADFCPFENTFTVQERDGTVRGTECSMTANQPSTNVLFESYGAGSRCVRHGSRSWTNSGFTGFAVGSGCYQYSCSPETGVSITVAGRTYQCSCEGQEIRFEFTEGATFIRGSFICPACSQICYDNLSSCPASERVCFGEVSDLEPVIVGGNGGNGSNRAGHVSAIVMTTITALVIAVLVLV